MRLLCSSQNREEPTLKILVHLIDRFVHTPGKMLIHLGSRDGKRLRYRTFAVEKNKMAERVFGLITTLLRIVLQQNLSARRVFEHRPPFAGVVQSGSSLDFIRA